MFRRQLYKRPNPLAPRLGHARLEARMTVRGRQSGSKTSWLEKAQSRSLDKTKKIGGAHHSAKSHTRASRPTSSNVSSNDGSKQNSITSQAMLKLKKMLLDSTRLGMPVMRIGHVIKSTRGPIQDFVGQQLRPIVIDEAEYLNLLFEKTVVKEDDQSC